MKFTIEEMVSQRNSGRDLSQDRSQSHLGVIDQKTTAPVVVKYTQTRQINVPDEVLRRNRILVDKGVDAISAAYKILRTQVLLRMRQNGWNTLAITSARPGEGKTLTSINLAIALARELNNTVLLVDLDLRNPSIHRYFEFEPELGISDFLITGAPIQEMLVNPGIERLVILPGKHRIDNSSEMLSSPDMLGLVSEIRGRYPRRLVLFDMPPLLSTDDVMLFGPYVDSVLLVVGHGKTKKKELSSMAEMLSGINLLGTVINRSDEMIAAYGGANVVRRRNR